MDAARLTDEPGWFLVKSTPELHQRALGDCGAASLAMIAHRWNVQLSVDGARAALPEPVGQGTRLGDLRDVARAFGLEAFAIAGDRTTLLHEVRMGRPVIVGLILPYSGKRTVSHYEVVVAVHPDTNQFVTNDPANGRRLRTWADLDAEWRPAGWPALVVLGPLSTKAQARNGIEMME